MPLAKSDHYESPDRVFIEMIEQFGIHREDCFDPCPLHADFNGLEIDWKNFNYVNPPYSLLTEFVTKALHERAKQRISVMLLPAKTDQGWFHFVKKFKIHWFKGRLKFKNEKNHATQPHFMVLVQ